MRVEGIGVDLIEISRIAASLTRLGERWLERLFSPRERAAAGFLARIEGKGKISRRCAEYWAARFAAKEAVIKALGARGRGLRWTELEILKDSAGVPQVGFVGEAAERLRAQGVGEVQISLSHSRDYAVAFAILSVWSPNGS